MDSSSGNENSESKLLGQEKISGNIEPLKEIAKKVDDVKIEKEVNIDVKTEEVVGKRVDSDEPANERVSENDKQENEFDVKEEDGKEESMEVAGETDDSPDDNDDFPGLKSELVVLDEVGESLDGKEDNGDSPSDSKEDDSDAKTSAAAGGESSNVKGGQKNNADDPYAYVRREDFTSEKYKIEIRNLPRYFGFGELKRLLNDKLKLASHKMKPTKNKSQSQGVFVCFKNEADKQAAIKKLNRLPWKGKQLYAVAAKPAPDPLVKKRKLENAAALNESDKKPRISDDEKLRNSTTPYWNLPYEEQLQKKYEHVMNIMSKLADQIIAVNHMLAPWIKRQKSKYNGMACKLLDIRKSPVCDGYRNKCEYTIGYNEETKQRMVGFRLGSYVQGHVGVGPIDSLKHIPQRMKQTVKVFEKFIRESPREPFNPETHAGHWKQLTLRLSTLDQLMAVVLVDARCATLEDIETSKEEVRNFFESGDGKDLKVDSLYFLAQGKREAGKEPPKMEHLSGEKYISECILGLKFRISPEAFFQVNTPGAGVLYSTVGEMIELSPSTTIVDICCGTGTIGLSLAKDCGQVLGLEVVAPAIEDAKVNAAENNISNAEFFTGRAEDILTSVLTRAKGESVYAIVDPPRSGLQHKAIVSLRGAEIIEKVVYVSCDPNAALKNFIDLARITSKVYHGYPLVPVVAIPVDMFPHTAHCEIVILFQRVNPLNLPKTYPSEEDDIVILSQTLEKSFQMPPDPENKGGGNNGNGSANNDTFNTNKGKTTTDGKTADGDQVQNEDSTSGEPNSAEKAKQRKRRPGRNQRWLARELFEGSGEKTQDFKSGSSSYGKSTLFKPNDKISVPGMIGKFGPKGSFGESLISKGSFKSKPIPHLQQMKMKSLMEVKGKSLYPKKANKRKWKKEYPPLRSGVVIYDEDEHAPSEGPRESFQGPGRRENQSRRGSWKESPQREMRSRSPPFYSSRDIPQRGDCGGNELDWQRLDRDDQNWVEDRERHCRSPERKLMRRDDHPQGKDCRGGDNYSPTRSNYMEEWQIHGHERTEHSRGGEGRFERIRPDAEWEKTRQIRSVSPHGRFEGDKYMSRIDEESWGPSVEEEFSFRRRKISGGVDRGRSNVSGMMERPSLRSCEQYSQRSPEMLPSRSSDGIARSFDEEFDQRSLERCGRRSSERFEQRTPERNNRGPCERCERRSSERVNRPVPGGSEGDFMDSRPKQLLIGRDAVQSKFAPHMERFMETELQMRGNAENVSEREYVLRPSSPRKIVGVLGAMELHRKNEVIVYRGPNDAARPLPMELEGRIAVAHAVPEDRASHFEKRYETNLIQRSYDSEGPSGQNDHSVIARRVEVIRRPVMVDDRYGMLVDTSGKSLGTAEVLLVTTKNHVYDVDDRSGYNMAEGPSTSRILEQREIGSMSSGNKFELTEGPSGRSQGVWIMERDLPKPWGESERSKMVIDQPGVPDASIGKFGYPVHHYGDGERVIPPLIKNPVSPPKAQMVSYPMLPEHGPKTYDAESNSQYLSHTPSHFHAEISERPHSSQNVPFSFTSSSSNRMPAPFHNPNSSSSRSSLPPQGPPSLLGLNLTAGIPSLGPNQLHPMEDMPTGSARQMPSYISDTDTRINSWNFRQASPWSGNSQQEHW